MKRILLVFFGLIFLFTNYFLLSANKVFAQMPSVAQKDTFYQGKVTSLSPASKTLQTTLSTGKKVNVTYEPQSSGQLHIQETIVVGETIQAGTGNSKYYFVDEYRLWPLFAIIVGFFLFIMLIAGWKGFGSIAGLLISLGIIFLYIIPQIIAGANPLTVCLIGALVILVVTTYIAHGISRQTTIALVATLMGLVATLLFSQLVIHFAGLTGYGDQEAVDLLFGLPKMINLQGLFLGGIILATLGALNDITITQAAAIFSLHKSNPSLTFKDLAKEGYEVGREHALSLINTLVLAFTGTALSLFIFLLANPNGQPLWVILNSEFLVEEIMKTIAGTAGLLLAVPLVTLFAALFCDKVFREGTQSLFTAFFK